MATPRADTYTAASGSAVAGGRSVPLAWVPSTLADNTYFSVSGSSWNTNVNPLVVPAVSPAKYIGGAPPAESIVDAYSDLVYCPFRKVLIGFGGGHNNNSYNGVVELDPKKSTLSYRLAIPATPPDKYPPLYAAGKNGDPTNNETGPLQYPVAGLKTSFRDDLTDPADTPYNTQLAAPAAHRYKCGDSRNGKVHYFYSNYCIADPATGTWDRSAFNVDLGALLYAVNSNYTNQPMQQGTMAVYDDVNDKFFMMMSAGDAGLNWRVGFLKFDPTVPQFIAGSARNPNDRTRPGMTFFKAARSIVGMCAGTTDTIRGNEFWMYDMDADAFKYYRVTGDTFTYALGRGETIPANYDPTLNRIVRWVGNSGSTLIYIVNFAAVLSGTGTVSDPYIVKQSLHTMAGTPPNDPKLRYVAPIYDLNSKLHLFMSEAAANWFGARIVLNPGE